MVDSKEGGMETSYTLKLLKTYKGNPPKSIIVSSVSGMCKVNLKKNEKYIFYLHETNLFDTCAVPFFQQTETLSSSSLLKKQNENHKKVTIHRAESRKRAMEYKKRRNLYNLDNYLKGSDT